MTEVVNQAHESKSVFDITALLERPACLIGDDQWWECIKREGLPLIASKWEDHCEVIFLWRGDTARSDSLTKQVYIDIIGITDHHSFDMKKLKRIEDTDVWWYKVNVKNAWRCGYAFIPVQQDMVQPQYLGSYSEKKEMHRRWLRSIFPLSCSDPLNPLSLSKCQWSETKSPLHMPDALPQKEWQCFDEGSESSHHTFDRVYTWESDILGRSRSVWLYSTSSSQQQAEIPTVLILDGGFWCQEMPLFDALQKATDSGVLPASNYVFIDEVNLEQRKLDLGCSADFWQAISQELLPTLARQFKFSLEPAHTAVVGQSLGGLSAMYAVLNWPENFGAAVCQSGSFWWPDFSIVKPPSEYSPPKCKTLLSEMSKDLASGLGSNVSLNLFMEVGSGEDIMIDLSNDIAMQLSQQQNHNLQYRIFDGGHDRLCWRGGIIDGLSHVLKR
ncbi:enterochelin esterase [Vibrio sonorensis]|uniref:enterochelin esterase n=1 Tax=Vibrio sonorensis TaxID=1004316 RepID=UPI0008D94FE6|nr:enterochelin esterase [Vibrio sonorensis]